MPVEMGVEARREGLTSSLRPSSQSSPQSLCLLPVDALEPLGSSRHACILSHTH
jgi:hypothetical protein